MIADGDSWDPGAPLHADLCVVGAGPAGIAIALTAARAGLHVLILESGGWRPDAVGQALCAGEVTDPALHAPPDWFRRRCLGGGSVVWGGRCAPLDPIDLAPRSWLDAPTGWPIPHDALVPYWRRAHDWAELGEFEYRARNAVPGGMLPMFPGFIDAAVTGDRIERFSRPTDFAVTYADALERSRHVLVLLHATCTGIVLEPGLRAVRHVTGRTRGGRVLTINASSYILATGGLEVPRLLLASRTQLAAGVGNGFGQVGRHYMCHLSGALGVFTPAPGVRPWHGYERSPLGVYCRRRLSISDAAQQTCRMANVIARLHHPDLADPAHGTGALSALHLARRLLPREYGDRLPVLRPRAGLLPHLWNIAKDAPGTAAFGARMLRYRVLASRKFPSVVVPPRSGRFTLELHAEQLPNPASRVTLADSVDGYGMPRLRVDWRYLPADINSVRAAVALFAGALEAGGHGTLAVDMDRVRDDVLRYGAYGGHHLGTARMAASPRDGVVDANCRVHGVANLYVAGGAVFATSGQANPTLTILALALRLVDHLADQLRAGRAASAAPGISPAAAA